MTTVIILLLTVISIALIVYHHAVYPLLLQLLGNKSRQADVDDEPGDTLQPDELPSITILLPAYNEEQFIADKIRNLAILDYPADKLKIIIASDGSTDSTYQTALETLREPECRHCDIEVIRFSQNKGKIAILNSLISEVKTEILALSDISALISIDALTLAAKQFRDPDIAVVNGHYRLLNPGSAGEQKYWEFQSRLKANEASLGSVIGSHGAFYLIRTHLYQALPDDTINDDFIIPMQIVQQGYRSVYEDGIIAIELEQADASQDSGRRYRISAGNLQQALRLRALLSPRYRGTAFTFASGKVLRVLMPYLMIIALAGSLYLALEHPVFLLSAVLQTSIYGLYLLLEVLGIGDSSKLLQTLKYLVRGHLNNLKGSIGYVASAIGKTLRVYPAHKPLR
jgi:cellulose synthase/poly-beta-1,6-N-acetylglucosamine synthase-like glycosyltransferase